MSHFGRRHPGDEKHITSYPLAAAPPAGPTPVVLGINWYSSMSEPELRTDGRYWIREGSLGSLLGGHAICVKCAGRTDPLGWWDFYDQGNEGACVGFSESRAQSLLNRTRYGGRWLYKEAQTVDEWPGENYDGTSLRAGYEILRSRGHRRLINGVLGTELPSEGIAAYRWATSVQEIHDVIQMPLANTLGAVPLLNSWGRSYPHIVWLPDSLLGRLLSEDGEAGVITDR